MADEEQDDGLNRRDAVTGGSVSSDGTMDMDDMMITDSDDDMDYQPTIDDLIPPVPIRIGPQRAQSQDRVRPAEYLFNDRVLRAGRFLQSYNVLSTRHLESRGHANLESGGKVILPPTALEQLSRNSSALMSPMMFKVTNRGNQRSTHCGVLEFIAEERTSYMPSWMMSFLGAADHDLMQYERVELPTATFVKFQPQSVDFLEISDQRAVLENTLRYFACLTKGDVIAIHYNSRMYQLLVLETLPMDAVSIIDCDMNVDFAVPVGYVSPSESDTEDNEEVGGGGGQSSGQNGFSPFLGAGNRLNGRASEEPATFSGGKAGGSKGSSAAGTTPDTEWKIGDLQFKRKFRRSGSKAGGGGQGVKKFTAFGGMGLSLRTVKKSSNTDDGPRNV